MFYHHRPLNFVLIATISGEEEQTSAPARLSLNKFLLTSIINFGILLAISTPIMGYPYLNY